MNVLYELPAQQELAEATKYYTDISPALAEQFVAEYKAAVRRIVERPRAWPPLGKRLRRCLLTDFPYQLVYAIESDAVRVYAFAHLKRRPNYWRKRVPSSGKRP